MMTKEVAEMLQVVQDLIMEMGRKAVCSCECGRHGRVRDHRPACDMRILRSRLSCCMSWITDDPKTEWAAPTKFPEDLYKEDLVGCEIPGTREVWTTYGSNGGGGWVPEAEARKGGV